MSSIWRCRHTPHREVCSFTTAGSSSRPAWEQAHRKQEKEQLRRAFLCQTRHPQKQMLCARKNSGCRFFSGTQQNAGTKTPFPLGSAQARRFTGRGSFVLLRRGFYLGGAARICCTKGRGRRHKVFANSHNRCRGTKKRRRAVMTAACAALRMQVIRSAPQRPVAARLFV